MSAFLKKTKLGNGEIGAEILVDGEVIVESTTYSAFSTVVVDWFSQAGLIEEISPGEDLPEESL